MSVDVYTTISACCRLVLLCFVLTNTGFGGTEDCIGHHHRQQPQEDEHQVLLLPLHHHLDLSQQSSDRSINTTRNGLASATCLDREPRCGGTDFCVISRDDGTGNVASSGATDNISNSASDRFSNFVGDVTSNTVSNVENYEPP